MKITETASETVKHNIQVEYLKVLFQTVFSTTQEASESVDGEQMINSVISQLTELSSSLRTYGDSIGSFVSQSSSVSYVLSGIGSGSANASAALAGSQATLNNAKAEVANAQSAVDKLGEGIDAKLAELQTDLDELTAALRK